MSSNRDFKTICKKYFTPMENDIFKCKCGKILKQKKGTCWSNLMVHIRTQHETTPSGPQNTLDFMQCKKSQTIHDWIEWICMELRPFSFVESEYVKKNVKLEAISKNTLQKYMHLLTKKVEQEIIKAMPEKIALIVDGWTSGSTHYLGVMASFCDMDQCARKNFDPSCFDPIQKLWYVDLRTNSDFRSRSFVLLPPTHAEMTNIFFIKNCPCVYLACGS